MPCYAGLEARHPIAPTPWSHCRKGSETADCGSSVLEHRVPACAEARRLVQTVKGRRQMETPLFPPLVSR